MAPWGCVNTTEEPELCQTKFREKLGFKGIRSCFITGCVYVSVHLMILLKKKKMLPLWNMMQPWWNICKFWSWYTKTSAVQSAWLGSFLISFHNYLEIQMLKTRHKKTSKQHSLDRLFCFDMKVTRWTTNNRQDGLMTTYRPFTASGNI